jgi:hypothetical protein
LLDAGATRVSAEEFRREVMQRFLVGPLEMRGSAELMYAENGRVYGSGVGVIVDPKIVVPPSTIYGEWGIDDRQRVCAAMNIASVPGQGFATIILPKRCQFWFKHGDKYYLVDSDSDRSAAVVMRTLKQ